jgi:hypothetical protein
MDLDRLSRARLVVAERDRDDERGSETLLLDLMTELLADRDRWAEAERRLWVKHEGTVAEAAALYAALKAENASLRSRVRVEAEDVAGLTLAHVHAWERANGLETSEVNKRSDEHALARGRGHGLLAQLVRDNARRTGRPGLDILDEMAAMEVPK